MKERKVILLKVMLATILSIIFSLIMYGIFVPIIMNYSDEYLKEFLKKFIINTILLTPLALITVYFLYKPADSLITKIEDNLPYSLEDLEKGVKATKNIQSFLFLVCIISYDFGIFLAFIQDLIKTGKLDLIHFVLRLVIGTLWGLLNGILTARLLSIFLIQTKLKFQLFETPKNIKIESHFFKIILPLVVLIMFLTSISIIIFYKYTIELNININTNLLINFKKILFIYIFFFFLFSAIIYVLLKESNEYLSNLSNQLKNMISEETDLSKKIKITTFDDMGIISDKINKIIDKLTFTFKEIQDVSNNVFIANEKSKNDIEEYINFTKKLEEMIGSIEKKIENQLYEMKNMLENFNNIITSSEKSISRNNEHIEYINTTSEYIKSIIKSFDFLIDSTLKLDKEFNIFLDILNENNENIRLVINAINETNETSLKINEIINVISDIAAKTNLLSMNASIEAAHAGEYGKGFNIVADEIRKLSLNTSNSIKNIGSLIKEMNSKIKNSKILFDKLIESQNILQKDSVQIEKIINEISLNATSQINQAKESENKINILIKNANEFKLNMIEQQNQFNNLKTNISFVTNNITSISESSKSMTNSIKDIILYFDNIKEIFPKTISYIVKLKETILKFKI